MKAQRKKHKKQGIMYWSMYRRMFGRFFTTEEISNVIGLSIEEIELCSNSELEDIATKDINKYLYFIR